MTQISVSKYFLILQFLIYRLGLKAQKGLLSLHGNLKQRYKDVINLTLDNYISILLLILMILNLYLSLINICLNSLLLKICVACLQFRNHPFGRLTFQCKNRRSRSKTTSLYRTSSMEWFLSFCTPYSQLLVYYIKLGHDVFLHPYLQFINH